MSDSPSDVHRSVHLDCPHCGRPVRVYYVDALPGTSAFVECPYGDCKRVTALTGVAQVFAVRSPGH